MGVPSGFRNIPFRAAKVFSYCQRKGKMLQPRSVSEKCVRCSITRRLGSFEGIRKNVFHLRPISCWSYMACMKTPSSNPSKQGQLLYIICECWDIDARELDNQTPRAKSGKKGTYIVAMVRTRLKLISTSQMSFSSYDDNTNKMQMTDITSNIFGERERSCSNEGDTPK